MTQPPPPLLSQTDTARWAENFLRANLEAWRRAASQPSGLFYPFLDRQWRRKPPAPLTLVSQCRLIYNFSRGAEIWQDDAFQDAARAGLDALTRLFALTPGRWRWSVSSGGAGVDDTSDAYGHAFAVLALATAGRVLGEPAWVESAWQTWEHVRAAHTDQDGGLLWRVTGPDAFDTTSRSQNPLMHSFEALMALHAAAPNDNTRVQEAAQDLLGFVSNLAGFRAGALIEDYTTHWQPKTASDGGVVNIGHQFEWAWLLSEWHGITHDPESLEMGKRFLRTAITWGLGSTGGVCGSCTPDGSPVDSTNGLWPQCEGVRALHRYAAHHGQPQCDTILNQAIAFYRAHYEDTEFGGVFAGPAGSTAPASQDKGDAWKLDYHTLGMCVELMDVSALR